MNDRDDRTEAPTAKRRQEARTDGNVARSTEVNSVVVLLAGLVLVRIFVSTFYEQIATVFNTTYVHIGDTTLESATIMALFMTTLARAGRIILPIALGILVFGVGANLVQVGWLFSTKPLQPKLDKLNPISGMKKFFSLHALVDLAKSILKIAIVGTIAYMTIRAEFPNMLLLGHTSVGQILLFILTISFKIVFRVCLALLILAILDFAYQKFEYERNLKMTRQEVKDERKQMEGDPKVKSRIRRLQIEMARRRMMREVPRATVVVTNPTFIAIAIRYEAEEMDTPVVLAKGKRLLAERIKQIAQEADVPIVEDRPLARAMYDKVDVGQPIPLEFFTAVAEILAYVLRLKTRAAA